MPENETLRSLRNENTHMLMSISHGIQMFLNKINEPNGITGKQAGMLLFISRNSDKKLTQRNFEKEFGLCPSTINSVLNYLEDGGFITRNSSSSDGRANIIKATEKGKKLYTVIAERVNKQEEIIVKGFSDEEKAQLHNFLRRISQNIFESLMQEADKKKQHSQTKDDVCG